MAKLTTSTASAALATRKLRWIIDPHAPEPAAKFARVEAGKNNDVTFTAGNPDCQLEVRVPGETTGAMIIPLEKLHKFFASTAGDVVIEKVGGKISGRVGHFNINFSTLELNEFSIMSPGRTPTAGFMAVADVLGWATQYPEHAIAQDGGLYMHWSADKFATAAHDGRQLVCCNLSNDIQPLGRLTAKNFEGVIPRKAILILNRLLLDIDPDSGEKIAVQQFDGKNGRIVFAADNWRLTTKCLGTPFPKYASLIPAMGTEHKITVLSALLEGAAKAMKAMTGNIRIEATDRELLVSVKSGTSETLEMVEAEVSRPATIDVNCLYLLNALSNCDDSAVVEFAAPTSAVRIIDPEQPDLIMVILPEQKAGDASEISAPLLLPKPKLASTNAGIGTKKEKTTKAPSNSKAKTRVAA